MGERITHIMDVPFQEAREGTKWRILQLDPRNACPSSLIGNAAWFYGAEDPKKAEHKHNIGEVVAYFGSDWEHPEKMNGQVTIWMKKEKHVFDKSFMMYAPPGDEHCPYTIDAVDRPLYHTAYPIGRGIKSERFPEAVVEEGERSEPQYDACFITDAEGRKKPLLDGEVPILHLDDEKYEKAPTIDLSWLTKGDVTVVEERVQEKDEQYLFMGSDWENALKLHASVTVTVNGDTYELDHPAYIWAPKGTRLEIKVGALEAPVMLSVCSPSDADPWYPEFKQVKTA